MSREMIERALERATDTKACEIGNGAMDGVAAMLKAQFPGATRAIAICDPRTRAAAGERAEALLKAAGIDIAEHVLEPGGRTFHADYRYVEEVRDALKRADTRTDGKPIVPVAVGSGSHNWVIKR